VVAVLPDIKAASDSGFARVLSSGSFSAGWNPVRRGENK
jgi:hypothetical protein